MISALDESTKLVYVHGEFTRNLTQTNFNPVLENPMYKDNGG